MVYDDDTHKKNSERLEMPRIGFSIKIIACAALQVLACSAYAGVLDVRPVFGVTLDSGSPTSADAGAVGDTDVVAYELVTGVSVSQDGSYQYRDTGYIFCSDGGIAIDQRVAVYDGAPDPSDWSVNFVENNDDGGDFDLLSSKTYTFLVRQYSDSSGLGSTAFQLFGPGSVTGLPTSPVARECGTISVEFDGTEPLAFIDGENLQYVVVGTFDSDGVTEAIADYDLGYEDLDSPNDLDSYAVYYPITAPVPFSQNDPAWDAYTDYSDDDDDVVLPAGKYTLVVMTYDEGPGIVGVSVRGRSGNIRYRSTPTPVPALPLLGLLMLSGLVGLFGLRKLTGLRQV